MDEKGMGGKFNAQECVRMDSLKCVSKPQEKALLYMKKKDLQGFTDFINTKEVEDGAGELTHWINQPVDEEGANLVELAVRDGLLGELRALLGCGARIDLVGAGSGLTPLHVAVKHGRNNILKLLIESRPEVDINIVSSSFTGGYTPLHTAAEINNIQALQFILQHDDVDVDAKDIRGSVTPLLLAVKGKHIQAARCLIENGGNLDHKAGPKTIRQHIISDLPDLQLPIEVKRSRALNLEVVDNIFMLLKNTELGSTEYSAQFGQFKTYISCFRRVSEQDMAKVVYLACEKGLWEHISLLLEKKINPDCCPHGILEAGFYGHFKVLEIFKKFGANFGISKEKETLLHRVLRMEYQNRNKEDFEKCLKVLIGNPQDRVGLCMKRLINRMDGFGNTALHYATQYWTQITVRELLELGANIGMKNEWGELPISRIRPDTMEQFLDDFCLTSSGDIVQENFEITFRYDFLAPNEDALPEKFRGRNLEDAKENLIIDKDVGERRAALPETEPLWYMSRSKEHRFLLKHPVITSFLWYKWGRLRTYFNRNLRFFTLFVFLLTWFIFNNYGGKSSSRRIDLTWYLGFIGLFILIVVFIIRDWVYDYKDLIRETSKLKATEDSSGTGVRVLRTLLGNMIEVLMIIFMCFILIFGSGILETCLIILLILLILRELLQTTVSFKRYIFSIENIVEICIISLTIVLIVDKDGGRFELNRHLAAIVLLLSWGELIVLVGVHPKLKHCNIYVTIFFKVLRTFFWFLAWYSLFIVAFGFGFYIILHQDTGGIQEPDDDPYPFFNQTWLSVVKTTTMFVGELEFSDLPFDLNSPLAPLSYIFFLSFIFLMVVVLMNLLNGLAVSDTGIIREKAEIFSYRSKVETISTLESMLLGDPFDFLSNVPEMVSRIPSCSLLRQLYRNRTLGDLFKKIGSSEILLFYRYLENKQITIKPNQTNKTCCRGLSTDEMGRDIISSAKEIILRKNTRTEDKVLEDRMERIEDKMQGLEDKLDKILAKLSIQ